MKKLIYTTIILVLTFVKVQTCFSQSCTWNGTSDTLYSNISNWSCVAGPSCSSDVIIDSAINQPVITPGSPQIAQSIVINAGARLTIQSGATLSVCGDFTNMGWLICEPGSTIEFVGQGVQTISGLFTDTNQFANFVIQKSSGSVLLASNIDIGGEFRTMDSTSLFDIGRKYMRVAGNFTNANGNLTFITTNFPNSTVEFNGSSNQYFTNSANSIRMNKVKMNKTGGKLYLIGLNSSMNIDSLLDLASGNIVTREDPSLEVFLKNWMPFSLIRGNANSFIDGKFRRKISIGSFTGPPLPASYDFPLGDSLTPGGYNLCNINFTAATTVDNLCGEFNSWSSLPPPLGPVANDCNMATYSDLPIFDNGIWTFERSGTNVNGRYNITLFNSGFTNNTGNGWTVAQAKLTDDPMQSSSWSLSGACRIGNLPTAVKREYINPTPGADSTSFNHRYATVQSSSFLSVEDLFANGQILLFPNPANELINLILPDYIKGNLIENIYDVCGRLIQTENISVDKGMNHITKNISNLSTGVYLLRITGQEEIYNLQARFFKN